MSPRTAKQLEHLRSEQREKLLRAARKIFATRGFAATKIQEIAKSAGVSYGAVYHYFHDKDRLFKELVQGISQNSVIFMKAAREAPGTPWARLERLCHQMLQGMKQEPEHLLVLLQAFTNQVPGPLRSTLEKDGKESLRILAGLIQEGQREGQVVEGNPRELARGFLWFIHGLAISQLFDPDPSSFPSAETVLQVLRRGAGNRRRSAK